MTYDKLLAQYIKTHGQAPQGEAGQNDFNNWVATTTGTGNWDDIPDDFFNQQVSVGTGGGTTPATGVGGSGTNAVDAGGSTVTIPSSTTGQAEIPNIGGNYNQVQNATQGGQFGTVGSTSGQQTQTQTQTTDGTSVSKPIDTLGFGSLLQQQAGQVGASDTARTSFLTDLMQNGGSGFQSQLDQGIRNSLTGPQMTGAGDSARARAAGYGAAQIGRTNLDARLGAAHELSAPTGLAALSTAANPYIGQSNTTSGSTTGLSDLVSKGSEAQAGVTAAQSSQAGAGQIPQGQPVKTGGCVLCTAAIELKLSNHQRVLRRVIRHKLHTDPKRFASAAKGYFAVFTPLAAWLLMHPRLARSLWPVAKAVVYEELRVSGRRLPFRVWPWLVHWTGHAFCSAVGATLPVKGYVDNSTILDIAKRNNILFEVQS